MDPARPAGVMIADVDQGGADEVILYTFTYLAIFKYKNDILQIERKINVSELGLTPKAIFYAVTTGDIPSVSGGYEGKEIIVYVKEWEEGFDEGWIFIFDQDLKYSEPIYVSGISREGESLRVANLDVDSAPEICLTGSRGSFDTGWKPYVFVWYWESGEWKLSEEPIPSWDINTTDPTPYVGLDVGELDGADGEEIVVYSNLPDTSDYQLIIYKYNSSNGISKLMGPVQVQARIYNVEIGDVNDYYSGNEIIAAGEVKLGAQCVFYLGVFDSNLNTPLWERIGEHPKEGMVFDTAIVK